MEVEMGNNPSFTGLHLERCCERTIKNINETLNMARVMGKLFPGCVFIAMFGNPLVTTYNIVNTDWAKLVKATKSIPSPYKRTCSNYCQIEAMEHSGQLSRFWETMNRAFI